MYSNIDFNLELIKRFAVLVSSLSPSLSKFNGRGILASQRS